MAFRLYGSNILFTYRDTGPHITCIIDLQPVMRRKKQTMKHINSLRVVFAEYAALLFCLVVILTSTTTVKAADPILIPKNIKFEETVSGLVNPLFVTHAGDGSGRLFIVQRNGKILIHKNGALNALPFLDIGGIITTSGGEQGLIGLAFDPDYESNNRFYVVYTVALNNAIKLARYHESETDPDLADPNGTVLLTINKPYTNHNGGMIAFGPDTYLYMAVGDGGSGGDPNNNAQNKNTLLGKLLRLDVSGSTYSIPPTNPFVGGSNVKEEIWAYGLRNPWRFSFDRLTGDLYIGDVGQNSQEEIDFQPSTGLGGENYGWRVLEGNLCYNPANCAPPPNYTPPIKTYNHGTDDSFGCSITGGYVYRGSQFPALAGVYLYGDFCKGKIWGLINNGSGQWTSTLIVDGNYLISSFGEDEQGELYLIDYAAGNVFQIVEAPIIVETFLSTATYDGFIRESSENSGQGGWKNAIASTLNVGDDSANRQRRAILSFDTAPLPSNAVITSVTLKFKYASNTGTLPFDTHGYLVSDIRKGAFNGNKNLELGDFAAVASKNSALRFTNSPIDGWYSKKLKTANLVYINKEGVTQFRLRFQLDDNNDLGADLLKFYSGDTIETDRPQLIVEYYMP
jgi:glucose/arabinose dehydrogenase